MTPTPTPQDYTPRRCSDGDWNIGLSDGVGVDIVAIFTSDADEAERAAHDIAALLRLRDAMTPEMWDHVESLLKFTMMDPESEIGKRSAAILASVEALNT